MDELSFTLETENFSLADTLNCGQCFRWTVQGEGFSGELAGHPVFLAQQGNCLTVKGIAPETGVPLVVNLFSLDEDYTRYHRILRQVDALRPIVDYAPGIRVMKQPLWECVCTFILSQNNNIPRITGLVQRLCSLYGASGCGCAVFPSPERLAELSVGQLDELRAGFRAKYLLDAARRFAAGEIQEQELRRLPLDEARAQLMRIYGVGPKVADCALLFGAARYDACPMDVWMKRAVAVLFPQGLPAAVRPIAGIAQQYIFHYARTSKNLPV